MAARGLSQDCLRRIPVVEAHFRNRFTVKKGEGEEEEGVWEVLPFRGKPVDLRTLLLLMIDPQSYHLPDPERALLAAYLDESNPIPGVVTVETVFFEYMGTEKRQFVGDEGPKGKGMWVDVSLGRQEKHRQVSVGIEEVVAHATINNVLSPLVRLILRGDRKGGFPVCGQVLETWVEVTEMHCAGVSLTQLTLAQVERIKAILVNPPQYFDFKLRPAASFRGPPVEEPSLPLLAPSLSQSTISPGSLHSTSPPDSSRATEGEQSVSMKRSIAYAWRERCFLRLIEHGIRSDNFLYKRKKGLGEPALVYFLSRVLEYPHAHTAKPFIVYCEEFARAQGLSMELEEMFSERALETKLLLHLVNGPFRLIPPPPA